MRIVNIIFLLTLLIAVNCLSSHPEDHKKAKKKEWVSLFNGKNLDGWIIKIKGRPYNENYKNTFRVVDGVLQVNYDEYDSFESSFGHIFYNQEFSNYKLRLQYRFTGTQLKGGPQWARRNSGVMVHSQDPKTMPLHQNFPVSIEVQLLGGFRKGERSTGNVCTPGTHIVFKGKLETRHCISSSSKTYRGKRWVNLEIHVENDFFISHKINGKKVLTYSKPQIGGGGVKGVNSDAKALWQSRQGRPLKKGYIALQSESHPVEFRKIELLNLN